MAYDFDLFVIGGGSGGVRCARIAAAHGARVGIAEARFWGGTCVNVGCVPKKIMVNAAEYGMWAADASAFGWHITNAGHDWATLRAARDAEVARLSALYATLLAEAGVTTFTGHASFLDPHTVAVGGTMIRAEYIVIATGGIPTRLPIPGAEWGLISDDLFALPQRPRRVIILGSGYIAVEFASILRALGAEVELIYRAPLPLRGFDEDLRMAAAEALAAAGITLTPQAIPRALSRGERDTLRLTLADDKEREAEAVFFCTGRVPNTAGLGLERVGVATTARGAIMVDEDHRTAVQHIFAIGDVIDRLNLTPVAIAAGHALADSLFGGRPRRIDYRHVPTAVFMLPPLASVGLSEAEAARHGPLDIYLGRFTPLRHSITRRAGRRSLIKLVVCQRSQKVLGAHMLGEDAPEILQGIAIALAMGATKQDFDRTIGIHPTAAEEFVTLRHVARRVPP